MGITPPREVGKHGKGVSSLKRHCVEVCALLVCLLRERQESSEGRQWRHTGCKGKLSYTKILPKTGIVPTAAASCQNDSPGRVRSPHPVFLLLKDELLAPTARPSFLPFTLPCTDSLLPGTCSRRPREETNYGPAHPRTETLKRLTQSAWIQG